MSQSVTKLKELLFDNESRELADISRRVDALFERAGTEERFTSSVAGILDTAFRKAEVERHTELADAVAPLVVRTVKTEIRNSRDELVEALYPVTGRMVKAYVASAMKDLANDINRRLEANPVMLRLRSLTSGKSVAEIALAEAQQLRIEELYLVRRGTGELIGRWPEAQGGDSRDHVMSGILTAINEFSNEALQDTGAGLRQIDIGERQLYLRASQSYLLAAKCSGTAPGNVESILDEAFLTALEGIHKDSATYGSLEAAAARRASLLGEVSRELEDQLTTTQAANAKQAAGLSPLGMLAWIIGVPFALWLSWLVYANYRTERAQLIASQVLAREAAIEGYPTRLTVERLGHSVTISGLAPTEAAKISIVENLKSALPGSEIRDQLNVLPSSISEIEKVKSDVRGLEAEVEPEVARVKSDLAGFKAAVRPQIEQVKTELAALASQARRAAIVRSLDRTSRRLSEADSDLKRLAARRDDGQSRAVVERTSAEVAKVMNALAADRARAAGQELESLSGLSASFNAQGSALRQTGAELSALISPGMGKAMAPKASSPSDLAESAEELAAEAERLATLTVAVAQALLVKDSLPIPAPPVAPTPRELLRAWTQSNAIFFGSGTDYRDPARTRAALSELAVLVKAAGAFVRVVGYTDEQGGAGTNVSLSQSRAQKVATELVALGVNEQNLHAVGRLNSIALSNSTGENSPNRRVEFELGFEGERAQ